MSFPSPNVLVGGGNNKFYAVLGNKFTVRVLRYVQFSTVSPGTFPNSRSLFVTSVTPRHSA